MIPSRTISFTGCRDSAIAADALREAIEDGTLEPSAVEHLIDFVDFSLKLCRLDGPSFLRQGGYPEGVEPSFRRHVLRAAPSEIAEITGDKGSR